MKIYHKDGSFSFVKKEDIHQVPGYLQDPKDPLHFIIDLEDCKHRSVVELQSNCCMTMSMQCAIKRRPVSVMFCSTCMEIEND